MKELIAVAFDTETTGLIKPSVTEITKQPQIIEFYGVKMVHRSDGVIEKLDEIESFLLPEHPISAEITRITGIEQSQLKGKQTFPEFYEALAEFHTGVDRWVAHNLAFDSAMVANELHRIGKLLKFPFPRDHYCTVRHSIHVEQRRLTLQKLHIELMGEEFHGAHRARTDVEAMVRCYKEMISRGW